MLQAGARVTAFVDSSDLADAQAKLDAALASAGPPKVTALRPVSVPTARTRRVPRGHSRKRCPEGFRLRVVLS